MSLIRADSVKQTMLNFFKHVVVFGQRTSKSPDIVRVDSNSLLAGLSNSHFDIDLLLVSLQNI